MLKAPQLLFAAFALFAVAHACAGAASADAGDTTRAPRYLTDEQRRELERIGTLGYSVGGDRAPEESGVTIREEEASDGYTLYVSADHPGAFLVDMDGTVLHEWSEPGSEHWTRAWVYPGGDILGVSAYPARLIKLGPDSDGMWEYGDEHLKAHHDVVVDGDGRIYVLMREAQVLEWQRPVSLLEDLVCILEPDGRLVREVDCISIPMAFYESDYASWVTRPSFARMTADPFHTNCVEVLDGTVSHPSFREGNILVTIRNMSCLAVVDPDSARVVWAKRGTWRRQHEARVTPDGNLMLFDNRPRDGQSRVVEYDVAEDETVWSYTEPGFFSRGTGAQQLLPNGNVLITESQKGRVFEVTRAGDVVWEFWNPARLMDSDNIVRITRAFRVPYDYFEGDFARLLAERSRVD